LLVNELKDTNAVVFDIRNNGGGQITLADTIPQLFAPNIVAGDARALVAPINQQIFLCRQCS
jgi:C-terminal processing protease CtpA/Prc